MIKNVFCAVCHNQVAYRIVKAPISRTEETEVMEVEPCSHCLEDLETLNKLRDEAVALFERVRVISKTR